MRDGERAVQRSCQNLLGECLRLGSQDLACGAVSSVRVLQLATPSEEAGTSMKRESGHPGARDLRQITRSPHSGRGNKDPTELLSIPRGGLEPPRGGWMGEGGVARHNSPLRPAPQPALRSPFRTGPGTSQLREQETKVPEEKSRGKRFRCAPVGSDETPLLPVRRIMNVGRRGGFSGVLCVVSLPVSLAVSCLLAKTPEAASQSRLGPGGKAQGVRVAHTLTHPPCLAAPLRPGKEGARAAGSAVPATPR